MTSAAQIYTGSFSGEPSLASSADFAWNNSNYPLRQKAEGQKTTLARFLFPLVDERAGVGSSTHCMHAVAS